MSKQEEREIEEGEIVEDDISVDDDEEELSEEEMVYDDEDIPDVTDLLGSVLMTPDGDTVCSALCAIAQAMDMQNKILIKILSKLS
jgi:hypothetical protein